MTFQDQLGRAVVTAVFPPRRIVSLVPSQTELLYDLGLETEVAGITKFCVHPASWFQNKARVGGTKTVNFEKIAALEPELIIGNKEENDREQIEALARRYPVWLSDVRTLAEAYDMMLKIGALTGRAIQAQALVQKIEAAFSLHPLPTTFHPLPCAYFIWRKPYMVAGSETFIDDMLRAAGFENVFASQSRYPEITLEQLAAAAPAVILLSSEPFPFSEKHFPAFREACPQAEIKVVDGELFSWYGSRLLRAPAYFQKLRQELHPKPSL